MQHSYLYSIGHGQKSVEELIAELMFFDIKFLIDVRSNPYSKWAPQFNKGNFESILKQYSIKYGYLGNVIGGRPLNEYCYDEEGYYDYKKMADVPQFISGIKRLIDANTMHLKVAVMCTETNPAECHRSKLIGRELFFKANIEMSHIIGPNQLRSQRDIMTELDKDKGNWPMGDLFNLATPPYFRSRKPYQNIEILESHNPYD